MTGSILHDPELHALILQEPYEPSEIISTNLAHQGFEAQEDTVFVKDWSEHDGLADALVEAGIVEVVREVRVGPFASRAYEVRVLGAIRASETKEVA